VRQEILTEERSFVAEGAPLDDGQKRVVSGDRFAAELHGLKRVPRRREESARGSVGMTTFFSGAASNEVRAHRSSRRDRANWPDRARGAR